MSDDIDSRASAEPGWYPDPNKPDQQRFWDGRAWASEYGPGQLTPPSESSPEQPAVLPVPPSGAPVKRRTWLIVAAVVALVVVAAGAGACAIGVAGLASEGMSLDSESSACAERAIDTAMVDWDQDEFYNLVSPEFRELASEEDMAKWFEVYEQLGTLESYEIVGGEANVSVTTADGQRTTTVYRAEADFTSGPAIITVSLIKHDEWQVAGFHIESEVFVDLLLD